MWYIKKREEVKIVLNFLGGGEVKESKYLLFWKILLK